MAAYDITAFVWGLGGFVLFFTELQNYRVEAFYSVVHHTDCHTLPKQITGKRIRKGK